MLVWGPITTVAQALFEDSGITNKIRIYSIGSWNTTQDQASYNWIKAFLRSHRNLWWIDNGDNVQNCDTFRGVYQGGNQTGEWSRTQFITFNVRGHGSTHGGFYSQKTGDAFPMALWPVNSLKEGDTPSMLYLLAPVLAGIGDVNNPLVDSWGGKFRKYSAVTYPNYYVDLATACQVTASRHRVGFLSDWKGRWDRYAR